MKKIIEIVAGVLSILLGIPSIWFAYETYKHEKGGEMAAFLNSNRIEDTAAQRSVIICLEDESTDVSGVEFVPVFSNSSQYTLKDFDLKFEVKSDGVNCLPNGFFTKTRYNADTDVYIYNTDKIPAFSRTPYPFVGIELDRGGGECRITTTATYDGAPRPFTYNVDVAFKVVPSRGLTFGGWKELCDSKISRMNLGAGVHDIYYIGLGRTEAAINANISAHGDHANIAEAKPAPAPAVKEAPKPAAKPIAKPAPAPESVTSSVTAAASRGNVPGLLEIRGFEFTSADSMLTLNLAPVPASGYYVIGYKSDYYAIGGFKSENRSRCYANGLWLEKGTSLVRTKIWKSGVSQVWQAFPDEERADVEIESEVKDGRCLVSFDNDEDVTVFVVFRRPFYAGVSLIPNRRTTLSYPEDEAPDVESVVTYSMPDYRTKWERFEHSSWRFPLSFMCITLICCIIGVVLFGEGGGPAGFFRGMKWYEVLSIIALTLVSILAAWALYYTA